MSEKKGILKNFNDLLNNDMIKEAEEVMNYMENHDLKIHEEMQRLVMNHYLQIKNEEMAGKIIAETKNWASQDGRIKKFEKVFDIPYAGKRVEKKEIENPKTESDVIRNALFEKNFTLAKTILLGMTKRAAEYNDKGSQDYLNLCRKIVHRESEIVEELCNEKLFDDAKELIGLIEENPHHKKHNAKAGLLKKINELETGEKK